MLMLMFNWALLLSSWSNFEETETKTQTSGFKQAQEKAQKQFKLSAHVGKVPKRTR
jgi:hypothetical protein